MKVAQHRPGAVREARLAECGRPVPRGAQPATNLRPSIAARSVWSRLEAILRNREFLAAYRDARARWIAGDAIPFPVGTYWLRRFAHVPLAS